MSTHQRAFRTEAAGISTARQSLDNVLSAKANLGQSSSSADKHCALEFQIAELEGMLAEIMDERFARMIDESQPGDENRNVGLLSFIIDTADNILASLPRTSNTPPPTYQKNHINPQPHAHKPQVESRNSSFPLPHDQRISKRKSVPTAAPPIRYSTTAKLLTNTNGVSKPLPNPFHSSNKLKERNQDTSINDLSLSAFQALKTSDAFKALLDRAEVVQINEIDRDDWWFSFKESFGDNVSKELLCAFDVLIRISSFERSSKEITNPGRVGSAGSPPRINNKGKAPLRSGAPPSSGAIPPSSDSSDSDFVTIESPNTTQSPQHDSSNTTSSSQPPPYSQHVLPTTTNHKHHVSCINCGVTPIGRGLGIPCGHVYCPSCAQQMVKLYIRDGSQVHTFRCRCNERIRKVDFERFISRCRKDDGEE